jgi:hypothetical protein
MKDEALKLALDWFKCYADKSMSRNNAENLADEIVDDIKAALAQPDQEPVTTVTSESGNPYVAMSWWHEPPLPVGTKLYTTPPQRTWVGLTPERIKEIWLNGKDHGDDWADVLSLARAFEDEIKRENT